MAQFDLKIDYASGESVIDVTNLSAAGLPQFVQGDALDLRIWLIQKVGSVASYLPVAGVTLFVSLGDLLPIVPVHYTEQAIWTPSPDGQQFFQGTIPMSTAGINNLFNGTNKTKTADFGVTFFAGASPTTALIKTVSVKKALNVPGTIAVALGQTPLSAEVANASYVPINRVFFGAILLGNESDHTKINRVYTDVNGELKSSPYTP